MSTPPYNKNDRMKLEIFDSFSKTVMRNTGRNIASASKIIKTNETVSTDTVQYILETQGEREIYPSEHIINDGNGHSCVITTEWLYQAMLLLTDKQKEVIILVRNVCFGYFRSTAYFQAFRICKKEKRIYKHQKLL